MAKYVPLDALVAKIEKQRQLIFPKNTGEMKVADIPKPLEQGWLNALSWIKKTINTLEVKEVDLREEIDVYFQKNKNGYNDLLICKKEDFSVIAKHFYELGMQVSNKAQKGE